MTAKLKIDRTVCGGGGLCAITNPELFQLSDDGHAVVLKGELDDTDDITALKDLIECCPTEAITLVSG
ncbi:ferredoxin [Streptomyces sp. NPDC006645]|uniref:ferredoxin n=1 Tax=unclassified Streptomyces TaxID=2593676 RepID=UPI0033A3D866